MKPPPAVLSYRNCTRCERLLSEHKFDRGRITCRSCALPGRCQGRPAAFERCWASPVQRYDGKQLCARCYAREVEAA
jgi:hypothetical protein